MKYIIAFFAFWWDFIVGDSITLAIGSGVGIFAAYVLAYAGGAAAAQFLLPTAVLATLTVSLRR